MSTSIYCAECGAVLAHGLEPLGSRADLNENDGEDRLPLGTFWVSDGRYESERPGDIVVNLKDLRDIEPHTDPTRLNGCCGLDGLDGLNLLCANGHEVGTERSDCWMAHHAVLSSAKVRSGRLAPGSSDETGATDASGR